MWGFFCPSENFWLVAAQTQRCAHRAEGDKMGKPSEVVDWAAVERRVGDGTNDSIRAIAREFSVPESTLRKKIVENEWCRDRLGDAMYGIGFAVELLVEEWKR